MPIKVACSQCKKVLSAPDTMAGKRAKCPGCGAGIAIPGSATTSGGSIPKASSPPASPTPSSAPRTAPPAKPAPAASAADPFDDDPFADLPASVGSIPGAALAGAARPLGPGEPAKIVIPVWAWFAAGGGVALVLVVMGVLVGLMSSEGASEAPGRVVTTPIVVPTTKPPVPKEAPSNADPEAANKLVSAPTAFPVPQPAAPAVAAPPAMAKSSAEQAADVMDAVKRGVVKIMVRDDAGNNLGLGAGFLLDRSGLVATNFHVMAKAHSATAQFIGGAKCEVKGYRAFDRSRDLAIIELSNVPKDAVALRLRSDGAPRQGSEVIAIGHPQGFEFTMTTGIVTRGTHDRTIAGRSSAVFEFALGQPVDSDQRRHFARQ